MAIWQVPQVLKRGLFPVRIKTTNWLSARVPVIGIAVVPALLVTLSACESGGTEGQQSQTVVWAGDTLESAATVRTSDSAGVHLIETIRGAWEQTGRVVTIADTPRLRIGSAMDQRYLLSDVSGVAIGRSGLVVVGNAGFAEVKAFSSDGGLVWTQGRGGGGPGEYRWITDVAACGKHLVIMDLTGRRLTFLSEDGALEHTRRWAGMRSGTGPNVFRCNNDGFFAQLDRQGGVPDQAGPYSANAIVSVGSLLSDEGEILLVMPTIDRYRYNERTAGPAFLGTKTYLALGDSLVHVLISDWPNVRSYSFDGELVRIARWPAERRAVTANFVEAEGEARSRVLPDAREDDYQRLWADFEHPDFLPIMDAVILSESGNLWVREYAAWSDFGSARRWWVLSTEGVLLGSVQIPEEFELVRVLADAVVGVTRDSLDVEFVEIRDILRMSS